MTAKSSDVSIWNMNYWVAALNKAGMPGEVSALASIPEASVEPVIVPGHEKESLGTHNTAENLTIRWDHAVGGNGYYDFNVLGMMQKPDFNNNNDSGTVILKSTAKSKYTGFTIKSSVLKKYAYLKIAIAAQDKYYNQNGVKAWLVFGMKLESDIPNAIVKPVIVSGHKNGSISTHDPSENLTIRWAKSSGGNGYYDVKVIGMMQEPDLNSESDPGTVILQSPKKSKYTGFTIKPSKLKNYSYLKIAIAAQDKYYSQNKAKAWLVFGIKLESVPAPTISLIAQTSTRISNDNDNYVWVDATISNATKLTLKVYNSSGKAIYFKTAYHVNYDLQKVKSYVYTVEDTDGSFNGIGVQFPKNIAKGAYTIYMTASNSNKQSNAAKVVVTVM